MPTTELQVRANQDNAQLSTGPRTTEGKAIAAANSLRHGFRSESVLIPGDDPNEFQALTQQLEDTFHPGGLAATRHVREMAAAEWRLRRARTHLQRILAYQIEELTAENPAADPADLQIAAHEWLINHSPYFRQLTRFEEKFERKYDRAHRALARIAHPGEINSAKAAPGAVPQN